MSDLQKRIDETSYNVLVKFQPDLIAEIEAALTAGATAAELEKALFKKFGTSSLSVVMATGAAHHIARLRRTCTDCGRDLSQAEIELDETICLDCAAKLMTLEHEEGALLATVRARLEDQDAL